MRILILGSGGREHALAWKLAQEAEVHAAPGNPGFDCERHHLDLGSHEDVVLLAQEVRPSLIVIGPENPLIAGLGDRLRLSGFTVFGPDSAGAQLEGSKAFAKDVMSRAGVPTAEYSVCTASGDAIAAAERIFDLSGGVVVKASGNALGKGVCVCTDIESAREAIDSMMVGRQFGDAGATVVIEELLTGPEFSLLSVCSESGLWSLPVAQDYKRAYDGDKGPNTGGMGSYSPVAWVDEGLVSETEDRVVRPALRYLASQGIAFRGVLFSGLMLTPKGVRCLEYNVRFGDPETQSVVRRVSSGLSECLMAAALGQKPVSCSIDSEAAVAVVMANRGYPGAVESGGAISIPDMLEDGVVVFHAGTKEQDGKVIASGGRVLNVTATGESLEEARAKAYRAVRSIQFPGAWFRSDIASAGSVVETV